MRLVNWVRDRFPHPLLKIQDSYNRLKINWRNINRKIDLEPERTPSNLVGACWTPTRLELLAWLRRNTPPLAELYQGAVLLMYETPLPGKVRFISHSVREIRNRLPDVIAGPMQNRQLQYKNRLDEIARVWEGVGFSLDGTNLSVNTRGDIEISPDIEISRHLYRLIESLVKDHNETRVKPKDAAIRLFEGVAPENQPFRETLEPIVVQWINVTEWFMKKTHVSNKVDADYDEQEFRSQFELFEALLYALVGSFYSTLEELDEILEEANA